MPWAAAAAAAAAITGAVVQSNSAKKAAATQARSADAATAEQARQFEQIREDQAPYRTAGTSALRRLQGFMGMGGQAVNIRPDVEAEIQRRMGEYGHTRDLAERDVFAGWGYAPERTADDPNSPLTRKFTVDDFWQDPVTKLSLQFGLDEGRKALEARAPLTTGRDSGAMLKELTKWGTDYTGSKAGESYNRFENDKTSVYNKLASLAGLGQTSANTVAQAGMNNANNSSSIITGLGNTQGAAQIAQGNAWGGALSNMSNWWNQKQTLDRMDGWFNRGGQATQTFPYNGYGRAGDYQYG